MQTKIFLIALLSLSIVYACHSSCTCPANSNVCASCLDANSSLDTYFRSCPCNAGFYRSTLYPYSCTQNIFTNASGTDISTVFSACQIEFGTKLDNAIIKGTATTTVVANKTFFQFKTKLDLSQLSIAAACLPTLTKALQYRIGGVYVNIPAAQLAVDANGDFTVTIPLITLYTYSDTTTFSSTQITQSLHFQLKLSVGAVLYRTHTFDITIYTNRDEVQTFVTNVATKTTSGCGTNKECIVVADLDINGYICADNTCVTPRANNDYNIGDIFIAKIFFTDPSYTKHLELMSAYVKTPTGIVTNVSLLMTTTIHNYYIEIFLPLDISSNNLLLQVNLRIDQGRFRSLQSDSAEATATDDDGTRDIQLTLNVSSSGEGDNSNFSPIVLATASSFLAALALLI